MSFIKTFSKFHDIFNGASKKVDDINSYHLFYLMIHKTTKNKKFKL